MGIVRTVEGDSGDSGDNGDSEDSGGRQWG